MPRSPGDDDDRATADLRDTQLDAKRTRSGVIERSTLQDKPEDKLVGSMFGPYLVQDFIGRGAMGVVYRAEHIDTNRVVALKVLRRRLLDEPTVVGRFLREARLAARIGHPHLGSVFELVEVDAQYGLAMELVEGEPLSELPIPMPGERAALIVGQLLRALEHAHAMGLVHRDLKPDNVLVERRNGRDHARIIDFGIAIASDGSPESVERLTGAGQIIGTPAYMSPEQGRGSAVDHRSDLYSLGTMMYELLSGVLPYEARKPIEILSLKMRKDAPEFAQRAPGVRVDPLLERLCMKLMARVVDDRFATARQALTVLEMIATDRKAAGVMLGIMDVDKAMAVVSLPPPPATR